MKTRTRIICLAVAALLLLGALSGLLGVMARAAEDDGPAARIQVSDTSEGAGESNGVTERASDSPIVTEQIPDRTASDNQPYDVRIAKMTYTSGSKNTVSGLKSGDKVDVQVEFKQRNTVFTEADRNTQNDGTLRIKLGGAFSGTTTATIGIDAYESPVTTFLIEITNVECRSNLSEKLTIDSFDTTINGKAYSPGVTLSADISSYRGYNSGNSGSGDGDDMYSSDIVVESVQLSAADGAILDTADEDTKPFNVTVTYVDLGANMRTIDPDEFTDNAMEVYLTEYGGFQLSQGTRGTIKYINESANGSPRFRITFKNVRVAKGGGGNSLSFRVNYDVFGEIISGTGSATVTQVSGEDEDKLAPLIPHLIVSQYSYGEEQIAAGDEFTLGMSIKNTSADIPLENIVMTIIPQTIAETTSGSTQGGITITSASNTYYFDGLGVGESHSQSIGLRAEPNAAVGSHKIEIKFQFQYVDEVNKKRETAEDAESIAIPVTQIDRFGVDPITDMTESIMMGDEGYISLSFINRGKSTTYNISGTITGNIANSGQAYHSDNLEAGKSGSIDFDVVPLEPGDVKGEITLQYEDENTNEKEIVIPYTLFVEERDVPPPTLPDDELGEMEQPPPGVGAASLVLCILGGLMMAVPVAVYLFKRVRLRGIEALDEDF